MAKINMKETPFFLDEEAQEWVLDTWKKMSLEQKCGQVFCPMGLGNDPELLKHLTQDIGVGGLMYRADTTKNIQQTHRICFSIILPFPSHFSYSFFMSSQFPPI